MPDLHTRQLAALLEGTVTRRGLLKRAAALGVAVPVAGSLLAACAENGDDEGTSGEDTTEDEDAETEEATDETAEEESDETPDETEEEAEETEETGDDTAAEGEGQRGGTLDVALIGEPPTLDIHQTTANIVSFITWHIYEPLFTWDENFEMVPELAESSEVSDDGLTLTISLRQGVMFHNGDEMTAEDVIASYERWAELSGPGGDLQEVVEEINTADDYTIEFALAEPFGAFTTLLSRQSQGCAIYPASVIEASDETGLSERIGTGPYQLVEHLPDQHIHVERFEDYTQRGEEPRGYGGYKHQYVDEIFFIPVPDEAARVSGLLSGEYHYLQSISSDQFESLEGEEGVVAETLASTAWAMLVMNTAEGTMSNQTLRQAALATLDHEQIAIAAYGEGFYRMDPAIMHEETAWHTLVGEELYNQNDPERAAQLMEEAGYADETIRLVTTQEYGYMYNSAVIAEQQWADLGLNIELQTYDWATVTEIRGNPPEWEIFTTGNTFRVDPVMQPYISGTEWPGWWDNEDKVELSQQLLRESDFETRYEVFEEFQRLFYEQVPIIKVADELTVNARSARIQGFDGLIQLDAAFWNVWLEEE